MILFNGNIHIYNTYIMERSRCRQTKWDGYGDGDVVREVAKFLDQYKWPTEWKTTSGRIIPIKTQYGNIVVLYCVDNKHIVRPFTETMFGLLNVFGVRRIYLTHKNTCMAYQRNANNKLFKMLCSFSVRITLTHTHVYIYIWIYSVHA